MKKSGPNEIRDVCRAAGLAGLIFLAGGCANGRTGKQILPADPDVARFARAGRAAFEAGSSEKAADLYQEALQKAEALDDTQVSAYLALNIAAAQSQAGRLEAAERAAQTASDLAARAGTGRAAAELLRARAAFASGALDRAESACAAAEAA
ncbi:MAG: hypothetical protein U1E27_01890, partial [Kiritimatiellia bacterium]|nr:hypothetical protein [Kiritimatiellia bacterium]